LAQRMAYPAHRESKCDTTPPEALVAIAAYVLA